MSDVIKDALIALALWFALSIGVVAGYILIREAIGARQRRRIARIGHKVFHGFPDPVERDDPQRRDGPREKGDKGDGETA